MVADGEHRPTTVLSVQKFESGPPLAQNGQLISADGDADTLAATKQEEWVKKKRVELTTTKQIETRVKRQIVLEDGKVVDDSGPIVTTNTTEDTDKQESEKTEHFTHGDDLEGKEGWVAVENIPEDAVVKETNERKITTHDEVEDVYETEEIKHLGDFSNEAIMRALREEQELEKGLLTNAEKRELLPFYNKSKEPQKRVVQQNRRHDRTTDIEDTKEVSRMKDNGNMITEITRRHEHEEFHNDDIPDSSDSEEYEHIQHHKGEEDFSHSKNENYIDFITYPGGGKNKGEKVVLNGGVPHTNHAHYNVSETINVQRQGDEDLWDSVSERIRHRLNLTNNNMEQDTLMNPLNPNKIPPFPPIRPNVLTNRPSDMGQEEYTKRTETNRWLNSHFGSSTGGSNSSLNSDSSTTRRSPKPNQGIRVTMTSRSSPTSPQPQPHPPTIPKLQPIVKPSNLKSSTAEGIIRNNNNKRITFEDNHHHHHQPHTVHFDLRDTRGRSPASSGGRVTFTKSGGSPSWDKAPTPSTPTPPPRYRRGKSPDGFSHSDFRGGSSGSGIMNSNRGGGGYGSPISYHQKSEDLGERKSYERKEQNFAYNGPQSGTRSSNNYDDYVTKHSNFYKSNETDNPGQTSLYENGEAEVEQRKSVERRERVFQYDGPAQKQFHPKYILGTPSSTIGRLKGIEHTGAPEIERGNGTSSQTLPRRRFYFGDDQGSLGDFNSNRALKYNQTDDFNVSISNSYNNNEQRSRSQSLNRSMSFTPRSAMGSTTKPSFSSRLSQQRKHSPIHTSNPQLDSSPPDLLAPKLLMQNMNRTHNGHHSDLLRRSYHSPTPPKVSDDYQETYRMSSSTPDGGNQEELGPSGRPKISTDMTSRFSRKTLRNDLGEATGQVESSDTTTRTKSRYQASEVMYPNGRRVASPGNFITSDRRSPSGGTIVIPVRDSNGHSGSGGGGSSRLFRK